MPQEHRQWFEERGFTGDLDIDTFTIELPEAVHQSIHGGGDWRLARTEWQGNWNATVMGELQKAEKAVGRKLEPNEVLTVVEDVKSSFNVKGSYVPFGED